MTRYILRRLLITPFVLLALVALSFGLVRLAPGDPFATERGIPDEVRANLRAHYHLDEPLWKQFFIYLEHVARGDLGLSSKYKDRTVNEIIATKIGASARIGALALSAAVVFGMALGIVAALRRNSALDYATMSVAMVGISVPAFVVGPLLALVFAMGLGWFDVAGLDEPRDYVLPALALSLPLTARIARLTRAGMLEIVHQDFIRTARAKGLPERVVVLRHALRGAICPVVSYLGPATAVVVTGTVVVEQIFAIPGLGREFVNAAINRDYGLTQGLVLFYGTALIGANLIVDILYGVLDPRVRYE